MVECEEAPIREELVERGGEPRIRAIWFTCRRAPADVHVAPVLGGFHVDVDHDVRRFPHEAGSDLVVDDVLGSTKTQRDQEHVEWPRRRLEHEPALTAHRDGWCSRMDCLARTDTNTRHHGPMVQPIEDGVPPEPLLPVRLAGAVWGHLVGDAVGVPYEFRSPEEIGPVEFGARGTYAVAPGTWSDDGSMMLALLDSLLTGRFDPEDQGQRYLDWADGGRYTPDLEGRFDIGNATAAALARIRAGTPAQEAGGTTHRDNGNGSLMRAIAVALVGRDLAVSGLADWAVRASRVTHGHALSRVACALYVLTARQLIRGQPERSDAIAWGRGELTRLIEERVAAGDPTATDDRTALDALLAHPGRAGRGYVVDSFWSAWEAFAGASDYRDTIERAIRYGHDTDTTAAIGGGLAGAYWGLDGIPHGWLRGMRGRGGATPQGERPPRPQGPDHGGFLANAHRRKHDIRRSC